MSSSQPLSKQVFKAGVLRWALNCSVTALILSLVSIAIASYALSFNVLPVSVKYARFLTVSSDQTKSYQETPYFDSIHSNTKRHGSFEVHKMQSSFLSNFFRFRRSMDDTTVIFQSIPLCGGDIFPGLVEKLESSEKVPRFAHVAEFTEQYPVLPDTANSSTPFKEFVKDFISKSPKPLFLFMERGSAPILAPDDHNAKIIYISLICDPSRRLIENYRVDHMNEDTQLQYALPKGMRMRTKPISFENCFRQKLRECYGEEVQSFILKHFCSNEIACRSTQSLNERLSSSLQEAKHYKAIGHLEEFESFLNILEKTLPNQFSGISQVFKSDDDFEAFRSKKGPLEGETRPNVTEDTLNELKKHIWPDYGFYWKVRNSFQTTNIS